MQSVGRRYVRYINETYHRSGTLWEGRFKSAVVSNDAYLLACSRYIELNPVRAKLASRPEMYPWSSVHFHAQGTPNPLLEEDPAYASLGETAAQRQGAYRAWLAAGIPQDEWPTIREGTQKGLMIGSEKFQREVETAVGRRLIGEQRGRPRKRTAEPQEKVLCPRFLDRRSDARLTSGFPRIDFKPRTRRETDVRRPRRCVHYSCQVWFCC